MCQPTCYGRRRLSNRSLQIVLVRSLVPCPRPARRCAPSPLCGPLQPAPTPATLHFGARIKPTIIRGGGPCAEQTSRWTPALRQCRRRGGHRHDATRRRRRTGGSVQSISHELCPPTRFCQRCPPTAVAGQPGHHARDSAPARHISQITRHGGHRASTSGQWWPRAPADGASRRFARAPDQALARPSAPGRVPRSRADAPLGGSPRPNTGTRPPLQEYAERGLRTLLPAASNAFPVIHCAPHSHHAPSVSVASVTSDARDSS